MKTRKHETGILRRAIDAIFGEVAPIDLCDFPLLLKDREDLSTFFQECSKEFPGYRRICLPLAMVDIVTVSKPPTREVLRLSRTLGRGRLVLLSNRLLPERLKKQLTLEEILFN